MSETESNPPIARTAHETWNNASLPGRAAQLLRVGDALVALGAGQGPPIDLLPEMDDRTLLTHVLQRAERQFLADHRVEVNALAATYLAQEIEAAREALAPEAGA